MAKRSDILTVLQAQSGDRDALDRLFRSVQEALFARTLSIVGQREMAEDVVQDVFVLAQRKLQWLKEPRFFRAWIFRIAVREAYRRVAKERKRGPDLGEPALTALPAGAAPDPTAAIELQEIVDSVAQLPPASRAVLTLHYIDDVPLAEIARVLELPVGTVKSRLAYGLNVLRKRFDGDRAGTPTD